MSNKHYINGQWISSTSNQTIDVVNPATEEVFTTVAAGNAQDIDLAVKAARQAFDSGPWPKMTGAERAVILRKIAKIISQRSDELIKLEVQDNGKASSEAQYDVEDTAATFEYYAGLAEQLDTSPEQILDLADDNFSGKVIKEPIGVAGAIIPWNYPLLMAAWKVAPALAAGCSMILKPSEVTPLTALVLAEIVDEAGLPAGVLNVVNGLGKDAGQALTEHPRVDKLAFTGSVPTGSHIMKVAAADIKNISLELGGKSPFVIFADSDLEKAVEWIMFGIFLNQGQICSATSRVLVEESIFPALIKKLTEEAQKISVGPGDKEGVQMGPLVNKDQYNKVKAAIEKGISDGATIVSGGKKPDGLEKGYFLEPTIFTDMKEDSWIWQEEIFGPVVCVKPFSTEEQAISLANDSKFGLAAAVMSKDEERCKRVARAFRAGIVWINCSQPTFIQAPWGGYKQSGIGRELGEWGLNNYLETKQITSFNSDEPWGWYIN